MVLRSDSASLMLIPQVTVVPEAAMVAADWCPSFACDLVGSVAQQVMGRSYRRHMAYPLIIYIALKNEKMFFFCTYVSLPESKHGTCGWTHIGTSTIGFVNGNGTRGHL